MKVPRLDSRQFGIVAVMAVALVGALCSGNFSGQQGRHLQSLQADLPVPDGFVFVSENNISKLSHASSTRYYRCSSPYAVIKPYYVGALGQQGWRLEREHPIREWGESYGGYSLVFIRDDCLLTLQFAGAPERPYGWDYAISVSWQQVIL